VPRLGWRLHWYHYAVQGNILVSGATVDAMAKTFEEAKGELSDRLVAA
jgi:uncharacterized Ntn-hydrolase superfamily protein